MKFVTKKLKQAFDLSHLRYLLRFNIFYHNIYIYISIKKRVKSRKFDCFVLIPYNKQQ